ncbi:MEMO1 family [Ampelomyces quisqualis]|uniref:MEMO1 family n=1 Tax=Ampelomyces quisqualis TaxID=50730 RepID=A0A6A5QGY3_AMPQU|nr:MEMO1 family [Ampelomyces quisqualis]
MVARSPSHAGSWYTASRQQLSQQLDGWLAAVPSSTTPIGTASAHQGHVSLPARNARAIIAPHAGYSYSGPAAAWAYKSVDWANAKRVFVLGPSHHYYLPGAATTACDTYATPLGDLAIDTALVQSLQQTWPLETMTRRVDEAEHSLEMHLPYIYKMLSLTNHAFQASPPSVPLVPLLIGNTDPTTESRYGALLAPYLADPANLFVISSDFCHWGSRFRYTYYAPRDGAPASHLRSGSDWDAAGWPIHESIRAVDAESMDAVESGRHDVFLAQLEGTGNTVCGRHAIGVFMAAVESAGLVHGDDEGARGRFNFVRYERSDLVTHVGGSSVSYASAFAVL